MWIRHDSCLQSICIPVRVKLIYGNNQNYGTEAAVNIVRCVKDWAAVPSLYPLKRVVVFPKVS